MELNCTGNKSGDIISRFKALVTSRSFRGAVSVGFLGYMLYIFDVRTIAATMIGADPLLVVTGILVFIVSGVLGALQWGAILRFHGIEMGFAGTVSRYFMGLFFNFILPGFVGGDVIRVYKTSVASGKKTQAFSSTLADRVIGLFVLVLFSFGALILMPDGVAASAIPVAVIMLVLLGGFIGLFAFRPFGELSRWLMCFVLPKNVVSILRSVYLEMHELTRSPSTLAVVIALSAVIQFTRIAVHWACGAAVGIELGFSYYALFVPLMAIMASLPISVGGFGVREAFAVVLFGSVGLSEEVVLSYTFLATFASFIGATPGGIAFALQSDRKQPVETL